MSSQYSPADYDAMLADATRRPAYMEAIRRGVRPGDVVVEVGTGLGYFAVLACRAGARHVYAIERTPSVFLAERVIRENGLASQVTCIHGDARTVELPERGSLYLADLRGMLPLSGDAIPTVVSVRSRLLQPGARMIPVRDTIYAAPCTAPARWRHVELALEHLAGGISRTEAARFARSVPRQYDVERDALTAPEQVVTVLEFATIQSPDVDATVEWTVARDARVEGIALWFEADLGNGVRMSTAPGGPSSVYSNAFLPLEKALAVTAGDRIACRLRAKFADGEYVYAWDTTWTAASGGGSVTLRQSALESVLLDRTMVHRRKGTYVPPRAADGAISDLLSRLDGSRSQQEIAREIQRLHPARFSTEATALTWVVQAVAALEYLRGHGGGPDAFPG